MLRWRMRLAIAATVVCLSSPALAALTNTPVFPQTPSIGNTVFLQGTDAANTYKTVYTGGANGSKCTALMAESNDNSATHQLNVEIIHGATTTPVAEATIPLSGGASIYGTTFNLMSSTNWPGLPVDSDGNPFLFLANGDTLKVTFQTALTATDQINVVAVCVDF